VNHLSIRIQIGQETAEFIVERHAVVVLAVVVGVGARQCRGVGDDVEGVAELGVHGVVGLVVPVLRDEEGHGLHPLPTELQGEELGQHRLDAGEQVLSQRLRRERPRVDARRRGRGRRRRRRRHGRLRRRRRSQRRRSSWRRRSEALVLWK
jgi:hypothetical protein